MSHHVELLNLYLDKSLGNDLYQNLPSVSCAACSCFEATTIY